MEYENIKPQEERYRQYLYIPYWAIKLEQIMEEIRKEKAEKYNNKKY